MRSRRSKKSVSVFTGLVIAALSVGCVPVGSAVGADATAPSRGCHDHIGSASAHDVAYSGEPSEYGNLTFWTSTDGTCSGSPVQMTMAATTLMVADGAANAEFLCRNLLAAPALIGTFDERTGPWSPAFGSTGFVCAG